MLEVITEIFTDNLEEDIGFYLSQPVIVFGGKSLRLPE